MPLSKHFRFCLWWESFFNGGHFSTCQTRKKSTPVTFFLHTRHVFRRPGVISLRRKMTPRSIFDGGRYSSLHRLSGKARDCQLYSLLTVGTANVILPAEIFGIERTMLWTNDGHLTLRATLLLTSRRSAGVSMSLEFWIDFWGVFTSKM